MALKPSPGGSMSPFCAPAMVTSTPHSSWRKSVTARDEMVSTSSSAGCLARSSARRIATTSLVTPVEVSVCTSITALTACALSAARRASASPASTAWRQSPGMNSTTRPRRSASTRHNVANWPVSKASTRSPGESVFTSAASQAPVPEEGKIAIAPDVRKIRCIPAMTAMSGPRWSITGWSIARRMRSGTLLGPGICRKCLPLFAVIRLSSRERANVPGSPSLRKAGVAAAPLSAARPNGTLGGAGGGRRGRRRLLLDRLLRPHPERQDRADEQQHDRAGKGQVPVAGRIDDDAEQPGRGDGGDRRAGVHDAARRARMLGRDIHRHRPDRADGQLEAEERRAEAEREDADILHEEDRRQADERAQQAADDDVAPRHREIAGELEHPVADHAAHGVADDAREQHRRGEQRRALEVEVVRVLQIERDPAQIEPESPAVAEIDDGGGHHARYQPPPRHTGFLHRSE